MFTYHIQGKKKDSEPQQPATSVETVTVTSESNEGTNQTAVTVESDVVITPNPAYEYVPSVPVTRTPSPEPVTAVTVAMTRDSSCSYESVRPVMMKYYPSYESVR